MLDHAAYTEAARRNYYQRDPAFQALMRQTLGPEWHAWAAERLESVGALASTRWADLAVVANEEPPRLRTHDRWGDRIDRVEVHPAYEQLAKEAYEAGVVWPRFNPVLDGRQAPWSVVFGLGYLMAQAEQGFFCPVCLTAGTAWLLERFGDDRLKAEYLARVASPSYDELYEGAMFLTERTGGSDVGAATTEARNENGQWTLWGDKWFASNGGRARAMMVLARPQGAPAGTRGLGLFLVPRERPDGSPNAIRIHRLKDKLGTRSMPSTELSFEGALAYPVGDLTKGFSHMAEMLNLSRIYNAVASVANMRRMINEALAFAGARTAFGARVEDYPMVRAQLIERTVEQEADLRLVFEAIRLLDRVESGDHAPRDPLLTRVLTPMVKYHTAREAVDTASWAAEAFGGIGYIEEWAPPRFLRDAQVLPIWEGTTNILVLDVLRSFAKDGTGPALLAELGARLEPAVSAAIAPWREALAREAADLGHHLQALAALDPAGQTVHAKTWCDRALRLYQAVLLLEEAERGLQAGDGRGVQVLGAFMRKHLSPRTWRDTLAGTGVEAYGAIVRHEPVSPDAAVAMVRDAMAALPR
jgi:alkylation response protein AidB-like acyl-CoA dehydrogenase